MGPGVKGVADTLVGDLEQCWADALNAADPNSAAERWKLHWLGQRKAWRQFYIMAPPVRRQQYIADIRSRMGYWAEWVIVRIASRKPFDRWPEWQVEARLARGPAVGLRAGHDRPVSIGAFILPRQGRPDLITLAEEDYRAGDPEIYVYGKPQTRVVCRVQTILYACFIRNLFGILTEPFPLLLLTLSVLSLLGLAIRGSWSAAAFQGFLAAGSSLTACLLCLVGWETVREIRLVRRERWFRYWRDGHIRLVGDRAKPMRMKGDSHELAILFALFGGLVERVRYENRGVRLASRFARMLSSVADQRGNYIATGRIGGPFGIWIGNVGGIERKIAAAEAARVPKLLLPASWENLNKRRGRAWLRLLRGCQILRRGGRLFTQLRTHRFVPAAAMKLGCHFHANALLTAVLIAAIVILLCGEVQLVTRVCPPQLASRPRWQPRTRELPYNLLRVAFTGLRGSPEDYFVMATAGSGDGAPLPAPNHANAGLGVSGHSNLDPRPDGAYEARIYLAFSPLPVPPPSEGAETGYQSKPETSAAKKGLDPHLVKISLYRKRSIAGLPLPPIRVGTYGLPDVELPEESQ